MKIKVGSPVVGMSGTSANSQLTYSTFRGHVYGRAKTTPRNVRSNEQLAMRAIMSAASKRWTLITDEQRLRWELYACRNVAFANPQSSPGYAAYVLANTYRRMLGMALADDAPL